MGRHKRDMSMSRRIRRGGGGGGGHLEPSAAAEACSGRPCAAEPKGAGKVCVRTAARNNSLSEKTLPASTQHGAEGQGHE